MGAVHSSIDPVLLRRLTELLPLRTLVATGTFQGPAMHTALPLFERIHTVEQSRELFESASATLGGEPSVTIHHGGSPDLLRRIVPELGDGGVLYWLDAHWCENGGMNDHGGEPATRCRLLAELRAIGSIKADSAVMIDDARMYLSPPPPPHEPGDWPDINEVLSALGELSAEHELMVVDDVIVFHPARIREGLREHARQHSLDWLGELARAQEVNAHLARLNLRFEASGAQLAALQAELGSLGEQIRSLAEVGPQLASPQPELQAAETRTGTLAERVGALERLHARRLLGLPARMREVKRRANRLATLSHHPPRPLRLPAHYRANGRLADPPTISIVTPSLNQADFLASTIRSVLDQEYPALEYVVQDGGSEDGTHEILERYSDHLHHWSSAPDGGQAQALNLGFARTSGEIMAYLNSDDMLLPGALAYVARYFQAHPEVDVVYGHRVLVDEGGREIGRWVLPPHDDEVLSWADFVPQETLFWRRGTWEAAGGAFDESFRFAIDWDALVRLRDAGARMVRLPRFLGAFRVHHGQKTTAQGPTLGIEEMDRIRQRLHGHRVSHEEVLRHIRPYLVRHVVLDQLYRRRLLRY